MSASKVFEYVDYKAYLKNRLDGGGGPRSGKRTAFARALGCQAAYLSRVLNGDAQLSLEQADRASQFFGHAAEEERFFFYLVLWNRAGTLSLRKKLATELASLKESQLQLKNRVPLQQPLALDRQVTYYSAWYYTAVHMLLDIDADWTPDRIARALGLSLERTQQVLAFLVESGLVERARDGYRIREKQTHLDAGSPLVSRHHINWRMRAIGHLESGEADGLHYSSVITVAREDIPKIREILLSAIEQVRGTVRATGPEEVLYSYALDLFPVGQRPPGMES